MDPQSPDMHSKIYSRRNNDSLLNEDRVKQLVDIGYRIEEESFDLHLSEARDTKNAVPEIPWEERIGQIKSFLADMGHLNIDHNYCFYHNLGGWAVEMTVLYKDWKDGKKQVSLNMIGKFEELSSMGFQFNVFPFYIDQRQREDHYELLKKYVAETGHARVPIWRVLFLGVYLETCLMLSLTLIVPPLASCYGQHVMHI